MKYTAGLTPTLAALPALFAALGLAGCARDTGGTPEPPAGEPVEIVYSLTRAVGEPIPEPPAEGTAYTFVSYNRNSNDGTYGPNPLEGVNAGLQRSYGYYAWLSDPDYKGILQPCNLADLANDRTQANPANPRNSANGQGLYDGWFQTVCLHPAIGLEDNGYGAKSVLFTRNDYRLASDPFEMNVRGYEVFPLPEPYDEVDGYSSAVPIRDIRSKVFFDVIQGTPYPFTITEPTIVNGGFWGWYHPLAQTTLVSYDKGDAYDTTRPYHDDAATTDNDGANGLPKTGRYNIFDRVRNPTVGSSEALNTSTDMSGLNDPAAQALPNTFYGPATFSPSADGEGEVIYTTGRRAGDGIFLFANNYTSNDFLQPSLTFKVVMNGEPFDILIPLAVEMEANHAYLFRLTVESSVIRVSWRVVAWNGHDYSDNDVGGDPDRILGVWTQPEGWTPHDEPSEDIGTPEP